MKVIFLAYREWALRVYNVIERHPKTKAVVLCQSRDGLSNLNLSDYDLLITCGWSDELGEEIVRNIPAIGVHCAELDRYSYGSPLQLQMIDGIIRSKHRVFSFTYDEQSQRAHTHNCLYSHEVDLDLFGGIEEVFDQLTSTAKVLFNRYLDDYPNITWMKWPSESIVREKRVPSDSVLSKEDFMNMDTLELYNFFRCLEFPYPNGCIEDERGVLYIEKVRFKVK